jgi:hypothetical protein
LATYPKREAVLAWPVYGQMLLGAVGGAATPPTALSTGDMAVEAALHSQHFT